jgi:hypothetical protein
MFLRDLFHKPDDLINLVESFNFIPDDLEWDEDAASFSINGERFIATVTPANDEENATYAYFFDPVPKVGNVDFAMITRSGERTQDTTGLMRASAFKVFAAVVHVVKIIRERRGYQVLLCVAKRKESPTNFQSRVSAYEVIVGRLSRGFHLVGWRLFETASEVVFAIFDPELRDGMNRVKAHLQQINKK